MTLADLVLLLLVLLEVQCCVALAGQRGVVVAVVKRPRRGGRFVAPEAGKRSWSISPSASFTHSSVQ